MATTAQIIANQKNAQSSTGPRTDAGKSTSSQNALKHGATSKHVVLAFENPAEFQALTADLIRTFKPVGLIESMLVDDIAAAQWRIRRMEHVLREYIDRAAYEHPSQNPMTAMADVLLSPEVQRLQRYENGFRRTFESAWRKLKELQRARASEQPPSKSQNEPKSTARPPLPTTKSTPGVPFTEADPPALRL